MLNDLVADLILTAGHVITINSEYPRAEAVAVKHGRILAVGSASDIEQLRGQKTEVINLKGRTVVPGFNDAHNHMMSYGLKLQMVILDYPGIKTIPDLLQALKVRAAIQKPNSWIRGAGYNNNKLPGKCHPTRWELDQVSAEHYIVLQHTSGHMCTVNSKALELLGIDKNTPDPEGGHIERDEHGEATGLLEEKAQLLASSQFFPYSTESLVDALGVANQQYLAEGITSQGEAGIGMLSHLELLAYQEAVRQGKLKIRSNLMILAEILGDINAAAGESFFGMNQGLRTGWGDDMLRIGPLKMFFDGSLIGKTAAVSEGYADEPDKLGFYAESEEKIHDWIIKGHQSGWQLAIHAIGDRAVSFILDCYQEALTNHPKPDHRHRIEHCGVLNPALIDRIENLGVIPVPQQHFIGELGDGFKRVLGPERTRWCYPQRSMLDRGIPIPGSSDRFVVKGAPLLGIHDVVNQKTDSGADYVPKEKITPEEAIRLYTLNSAHVAFEEHQKGSIQAGKLADFTILGADPTTIAPEEISQISVQGTIIGGELCYEKDLI